MFAEKIEQLAEVRAELKRHLTSQDGDAAREVIQFHCLTRSDQTKDGEQDFSGVLTQRYEDYEAAIKSMEECIEEPPEVDELGK